MKNTAVITSLAWPDRFFFSLSLGREKKGLEQFEFHTRLGTIQIIGGVSQRNVMRFQKAASSINYKRVFVNRSASKASFEATIDGIVVSCLGKLSLCLLLCYGILVTMEF